MNSAAKITAFIAALAATFGAAHGLGGSVGSIAGGSDPAAHAEHAPSTSSDPAGGHGGHADTPAGGLQISEAGYTLDLKTPRLEAERESELRFAIRDQAGRQVTTYQREHDKALHLILASRDLATYQHLHPTRAADGTWSTPVSLPAAGDYRVFADFTPAGKNAPSLTLGADVSTPGPYKPAELPKASRTATVDGYTVTLNGDLRSGTAEELTLTVSKDGRPVTDLQPYLGAYGHLVALRAGDLAYLHVHPNGEPGDGTTKPGPTISFTATAPSSAAYRLFLDFKHNGTVRTAAFTFQAGTSSGAPQPAEAGTEHQEGGDGHQH
ncbi:hypothetical protein ABZ208_22360 [Streptomyces sp. NPDC006208]|uniref:hypothetical protein n=1 Tax=Streptomyces sp. NPDC006208 TaxID=3156734 RepID=UPI0033BA922E